MKMKIELDLTPQEARKLVGLPDIEGMQKKLVELVYKEMSESITNMKDPEKLWNWVMPMAQGMGKDQLQKMMELSKLIPGMGHKDDDEDEGKEVNASQAGKPRLERGLGQSANCRYASGIAFWAGRLTGSAKSGLAAAGRQ